MNTIFKIATFAALVSLAACGASEQEIEEVVVEEVVVEEVEDHTDSVDTE